ncbi:MAG: PSD1 and planctomycete cytochrome C domain-containing protein [Chthoniobacteraceae bacterium]
MFPRFAILFAAASGSFALAGAIDFSRDIQPILSENCYHCHGPDAKARKAELRLDQQEGAMRVQDGVAVVKPGDSKASALIERIFTSDADDLMPPKKSNRTLTAEQKELLRRWVDEGAKWGEHWAFVAPKRPVEPGIADCGLRIADWEKRDPAIGANLRAQQATLEKWPRNPIDRFILDRLLTEGLVPSPEATPEKLCRRLYVDLTGLPPTPEEVDAFVKGCAPGDISTLNIQLSTLADSLLASPRYGERMVWEWLEAARYADTNGYQGDPTRAMWYWRDWAIGAFNTNMPFDQFTIEQIAGDLLPEPKHEQLIATGFHRNHMINGEGGRIAEESRVDYVQDRVETTGTVWLGLTFNCCRCHDHKFDPVTQREYYQLSAYFNSIEESGANDAGGLAKPIISFTSPEQDKQLAALDDAMKAANKARAEIEKRLRSGQMELEKVLLAKDGAEKLPEVKWQPLTPNEIYSANGSELTVLNDGSIRAGGTSPKMDDYNVTIHTSLAGITAFKLEALPDDSLINHGPGRSDNGNFVLTEVSLQDGGAPVVLRGVSADFAQGGFSPEGPFDGSKRGWAIMPQFGKAHTLVFATDKPLPGGRDRVLAFRLSFNFGREHTLGRFRLSATTDNPALLQPVPDSIRSIVAKPAATRSKKEQDELAAFHADTNPELAAATKAAELAKKVRADFEKTLPRTMVMRDRPQLRDTFILVKGAYNQYADKVEHGVPAKLPPLPADAPKNRLALAKWLVAPENPLTARVVVNRLWQQFFGTGIVKTADNFGLQSDAPSHPELLDWLAVEFRETGWDVKRMVKLFVTSAAYRQSSRIAPGMAERDPENRLLSRGPRHRLASWMLRDQALAASGLLVEKIGGPPVKTYQPPGIWEDATFGQIKFTQDHGEALYRRSLYIFWRRIVAPTVFFDVANRQGCAVKTGRTNTPLHALITMNDITFAEAARALAQRTLLAPGDDAARIAVMFRRCTARVPSETERGVLLDRLRNLREAYRQDADAARKLLAVGESKPDASLAEAELAAWTGIASIVLNLDETLSNE